jgi:flavin reductase (DIM6/NTAB) family NADH-FMN oxidoreductase RutF/DNA-binding MarR family transcriptional regulator
MQTPILETGKMAALSESDARALRRCFGQFGTGVTIMTSQTGQDRVGVTANSFSSLSLDPPLVLWSIKRTSRSFDAFLKAEYFAVNVLSTDQIAVSQAFSGPQADKFAGIDCVPGKTGSPTIRNAIAIMECQIENRYDGGDHIILIGRVLHFSQSPGEALLFCQGRYAVAIDHPTLGAPIDQTRDGNIDSDDAKRSFWRLMFLALHRMSRRFDRHREEEGINPQQSRVLIDLFDKPGRTFEQLVEMSFLPPIVAEDAVAALVERGYVCRNSDGNLALTEFGVACRQAMHLRWKKFEDQELAGIDEKDLERTRSVLTTILARKGSDC